MGPQFFNILLSSLHPFAHDIVSLFPKSLPGKKGGTAS